MGWIFWTFVGVSAIIHFITFVISVESHSKTDAFKEELREKIWGLESQLRDLKRESSSEDMELNKAIRTVEARLDTIKELL